MAVRHVPQGRGGLDISAVLRQLYSEGIRSVVAEGGPRVITSLLAANLADRVVVSITPQIRGQGTGTVGELGNGMAAHAIQLTGRSVHLVGDTIIVAADIVGAARCRASATPFPSSPGTSWTTTGLRGQNRTQRTAQLRSAGERFA